MRVCLLALLLLCIVSEPNAQSDTWPMKAHDTRRTGQSGINGPLAISEARSWSTPIPAAGKLNIGATVTDDGVFFGSWGLQRRDPDGRDQRFWDKADGQLFGLRLTDGDWLWDGPLDLDLTPRCYEYDERGLNPFWCGFRPYEVSYYNGTVEGQPAYDAEREVLYVGRGDGKLYAVHPKTGAILWRYRTFNPEDPNDPDGGGEIVTAPLLTPNGTVYFGTWGEGNYETNAFFAINPDGSLRWRWPAHTSLEHRFYASPALSPDASTVYTSTFTDEAPFTPASLYAFHHGRQARNADPLKWSLELTHEGAPVFTTTLAIGSDGTIYVGGYVTRGFGTVPVVAAIHDRGTNLAPTYRWATEWIELENGAQFLNGIALREENGQTTRLYATTANLGTPFHNGRAAGELYAVEPATGTLLATYDPSDDDAQAVGSLTSPAIGANGTVYVGVRGRYGQNSINGRVLALDYEAAPHRFAQRWSYEVDGHFEWNHPAIGPDGGLYIGASSNAFDGHTLEVFDWDEVPEGSTCTFYALRGPRQRLSR